MKNTLEIAWCNWISCLNAQENGADRIELFENLLEGGCTPSYGLLKQSTELSLPVYAMIRPRAGDFCYSAVEFETMKTDIVQCKKLGIAGIVFGILDVEGHVDIKRCAELLHLWDGPATFHRAFDQTKDAFAATEALIQLGFERILSSGQKDNVEQGVGLLKQLVDTYSSSIIVMPGCGVTSKNGKDILQKTGATEIHATCKIQSEQGFWYSDPQEIHRLSESI